MRISDWSSDVCSSDLVATQADGPCAGFGHSVVPTGACSSARQASMPDSPPQAIHGLLSAYPGRDAALAIRCRGFVVGKRSAEVYAKVSRVLAAGGRDKRAMDGARPSQDRMSCRGKSDTRPTGRGGSPKPAWFI